MARAITAPDEELTPRERVAKSQTAKGSSLVRLASKAFDPLDGVPAVPVNLKATATEYWLVQVEAPATKPTRVGIESAGGEILSVLPDVTYLVRATSAEAEQIKKVDRVRWVGTYEPAYKLSPSLDELDKPTRLRVWAHKGVDARKMTPTLATVAGAKVLQASKSVVTVQADKSALPGLARIDDVQWVDRLPEYKPHNNNALWVTNTAERDNDGAGAPGRLDGVGQTAAVADTGINYIPDDNGRAQKAFSDCTAAGICKLADYVSGTPGNTTDAMDDLTKTNSNHRKMAGYFNLDADDPNARSLEGSWHGTHVSGSVAGDYPDENGAYNTRNREADGMAVGARLIFQDIEADGGLGGLPGDPFDLFDQVYDLNNNNQYDPLEDARTHNNSYGAIYPLFDDGGGIRTDDFVWEHPDMMIVFSASNDGPDPGSLAGGPQESKNILTSCASANGRQPLVSMDAAAIFSSHGPTIDTRLKPDVCTPGQINVSPKGGTVDDDQYLQGTSMSGPMLVGLVTLVRQYYWDGFGPTGIQGFARGTRDFGNRHNPSAALVKASTINSAQRMRGYYTGDDGGDRADDGMWPSNGQGWGKVQLDNALFFEGDDRALFTVDRPNDDANGLETGNEVSEFIDVAPGQPLDITLAWTDAPSPLAAGSPTLVNNLDLEVTGPDGTVYLGNEFTTQTPFMGPGGDAAAEIGESVEGGLADSVNNVEGVRLQSPPAGRYEVKVIGTDVADGPQGYALVVSGRIATDAARIVFDAPKYKPGATSTAYLLGTGLSGDTIGSFTKVAESIYKQETAASGLTVGANGGGAGKSVPVDSTGPVVSNVLPNSVAADLTFFTWNTDERSTGEVEITAPDGTKTTYGDVYAVESFPGLTTPQNETKGNFQNKLVMSTNHEAYVTGLKAGVKYTYAIKSVDEAGNESSTPGEFTSTDAMFAPNAPDIAMLISGDLTTGLPMLPDLGVCTGPVATCQQWGLSTQMYAGSFGTNTLPVEAMPAFMFRLPSSVDPSKITGAAVELYSGHDIVDVYTDHTIYSLDMLDSSVEGSWGAPNTGYGEVNGAAADVTLSPDPSLRRGANKAYAFQVPCNEIEKFKTNLAEDSGSERRAAFRLKASTTLDESLFSFETGYGRRSRGPQLRPRLVLFMDGLDPMPCVATAAPKISNIAVDHTDADGKSAVVSWRTDVDSDSTVFFRKVGDTSWTPVSAPVRTTNHFVRIEGLEANGPYEFTVRSSTCNGLSTDDTNGGKSYALFNGAFVGASLGAYYAKPSPDDDATETVGWGSDQPTTSVVKYGTSPTNLDKTLSSTELTDTHTFELPALVPCTRYYFQVSGKNGSGKETTSPIMAFDRPPGTLSSVVEFDFEAGDMGWLNSPVEGSGDTGIPLLGAPPVDVEGLPTIWSNEATSETLSTGMRTVLKDTGTKGYSSNMDLRLISPDIAVPAGYSELEFSEWFNLEGIVDDDPPDPTVGPWEEPMVEISYDGGGSWKRLREGARSKNADFPLPSTVSLPLPQEAAGKTVKFAFRLRTDTNTEPPGGGWAVDDVKVLNGTCTPLIVSDPSVPLAPDEPAQQLSTQAVRSVVGPVEPVDGSGAPVGVLGAVISPPSQASLDAGTCRCTDIRYLGQSVTAAPTSGGGGPAGPIPATGWGSQAAASSLAGLLMLVALAVRRRSAPALRRH